MIISSPAYVVSQYLSGFVCLVEKNGENLASVAQNISALGMIRRVLSNPEYSDLWLLAPAAVPFLSLSARRQCQRGFPHDFARLGVAFHGAFQYGSESSSYIIALSGVCV